MRRIVFVNHKARQCGVYEFGRHIGELLKKSPEFDLHYVECDSFEEFKDITLNHNPEIVVYNYHPTTMPWIFGRFVGLLQYPRIFMLNVVHIGIIHEVDQLVADSANDSIFDYFIAPDPTLLLKNPLVFKTGRFLPFMPEFFSSKNQIPIIGSFGFGTSGKGFEKIGQLVEREFDEAIIRLNIPISTFGDPLGVKAKKIANDCILSVGNPKIKFEISHEYLNDAQLKDFLVGNSINVFLYENQSSRGISSVIDYAISCGRPIAISESSMFRHLLGSKPSISIEKLPLKEILKNGVEPLMPFWSDWSNENLIWDYERIFAEISRNVLLKAEQKALNLKQLLKQFLKRKKPLNYLILRCLGKLGLLTIAAPSRNVWTKPFETLQHKSETNAEYIPVELPTDFRLNNILDDDARQIFEPAINFFRCHLTELLSKKIPEANVQQAFVFDTSVRLSKDFKSPRVLAIGAYEDTAAEALRLLGFDLEFVDPILNYDLHTYLSKPSVKNLKYDIVIATSVIEHVKDDTQFVTDISKLLKVGGVAILTCDFNNQYKVGDEIPSVDYRFYTKEDITDRIMKVVSNCSLIDEPKWDCDNPDFLYLNKYRYTFASIVFKRNG